LILFSSRSYEDENDSSGWEETGVEADCLSKGALLLVSGRYQRENSSWKNAKAELARWATSWLQGPLLGTEALFVPFAAGGDGVIVRMYLHGRLTTLTLEIEYPKADGLSMASRWSLPGGDSFWRTWSPQPWMAWPEEQSPRPFLGEGFHRL